MKRYFFAVIIVALAFCANVTAQDGSHAFLKEGKVWNCVLQYGPDGNTEYYKNIIRGDSVVNGITYFKMYRETDTVSELDFYALWREDEGKVYTYVPSDGKERLMYDFSAQPESEVFCEGRNRLVKAVGKVTVGEQRFNCLSVLVSDGFLITWVEGIGSPYGPGYPIGPMLSNGKITMLLSCYEDGRLIFEATDFNKAFKADVKINEENFPDEIFRNWVLSAAVDKNKNRILDDDEIQRVTDIDVHQKKIASLKGIEYFTELHKLTCYQNPLTELDLSKNTKLDTLNCAWDKLTLLNVKNCAKLRWIRCDSNNLTELDLSRCTELKLFVCSGNNISALDVSACTKLDYFECGGNNLTVLDLSNNTELTTLRCDMNHLTTLDLSNNTKLMECSCSGNAMNRLILSKDNVLNSLECSTNQLYGAAMEHIVESLNYQQKGGFLSVFNAEDEDQERNVITTEQVAALNAKGWKVYQWIYSSYCTYLGSEPKDDYRPFVEEGKVWKFGAFNSGNPVQVVEYYYFDGDTIIDGKTCKQMMCQKYVGPDYPNYDSFSHPNYLSKMGAWYEEDKKVYFCYEGTQSLRMMYDFSLGANDTLYFMNDYPDYRTFIIGPKQIGGLKGFKGFYRDIMMCQDEGQNIHSTFWLEGVGGIDGTTANAFDPTLVDLGQFLMSCTVGDEVIYFNDEYEDGATPGSMEVRKRFDFTHTIKTKPKARNRSMAEVSVYGEYNDKQLGINLNPLDDAYLVRIINETGKVVYEKSINVGNIVGLNIDISAYAKGRYTVTVENSEESFTGEFNAAQGTGLEAIINNKVETRPSIYNLQGQRLSSLQKGLNIVNGQKVFVK